MKSTPGQFKSTKVLWALDAFHDKPKVQLQALEVVAKLFGKSPYTVHPVSLLRLGTYSAKSSMFLEKWHDLAASAFENLEGFVASLKNPNLKSPHLIKQEGFSTMASAKELLAYAVKEGVELIAVTSHRRKGIDRVLLGSFAESLVLLSPIPVVITSPGSAKSAGKDVSKFKTLLFPTDWSDLSRQAFERTVELARTANTSILLFHKVRYFYPQVGPSSWYPVIAEPNLKDFRSGLKKNADAWLEYAKLRGVKVKLHLDTKEGHPLDEIIRTAKKLGPSTLIAMASQTGQVGAIFLGSLTRQVLRNAPCPVLVVHPNQVSVTQRFVDEAKLIGFEYTAKPVFT